MNKYFGVLLMKQLILYLLILRTLVNMQMNMVRFEKSFLPSILNMTLLQSCSQVLLFTHSKSACINSCVNLKCTGFSYSDNSGACTIMNYIFAAPSCAFGQLNSIYVNTLSLGPHAYYRSGDVARSKIVNGTIYAGYAGPETTVSGVACGLGDSECWCSTIGKSTLQIDLNQTYTIRTILISPSRRWPTYAGEINIYVGNTGTTADNLFGITPKTTNPTKIKVEGVGNGRYIFLQRYPTDGSFSICLCLVEAFQ